MGFVKEDKARFFKIKFFLKLIFVFIFVLTFNFFIKISINSSKYYVFKKLESSIYEKTIFNENKILFINSKLFAINRKDLSYKVLYDSVLGASKYLYILCSNNNYFVYSIKTNKLLFSFNTNDFVFVFDDMVFTINSLYKTLKGYNRNGEKKVNLNFLSSILSFEYRSNILALGLSNGQVCVYRNGNLIYVNNPENLNEIIYAVKLSLDSKYLGIIKGKGNFSLEVLNLDNNFKKMCSLFDLNIYGINPFFKIDDNSNIFIETKNRLVILNLDSGKVFNINNNLKILRIYYDLVIKAYKIYFYDEVHNIINIRVYLKDCLKLKDDVFIRGKVENFVDFNNGILYIDRNSNLYYLGLNL